jgi:hypothetical protein
LALCLQLFGACLETSYGKKELKLFRTFVVASQIQNIEYITTQTIKQSQSVKRARMVRKFGNTMTRIIEVDSIIGDLVRKKR